MIRRITLAALGALFALALGTSDLSAQDVHVVKMVDKSTTEFAFEPAEITVNTP